MAIWDGEFNTDFSLAPNWVANILPANGELVVLDNGVLFNQPILGSTAVFNVFGVNVLAGTLTVDGVLTASTVFNIVSTGEINVSSIGTLQGNVFVADAGRFSLEGLLNGSVTYAGTGIAWLDISATGRVTGNVTSSGEAINRNFATTGISGNLDVTGGFFVNRGGVGGNTTVSGGELLLDSSSNLSDGSTVTVLGTGTLNVFAGDTVSSVVQTGGTISGAGTLTANTFTQSGGELTGNLFASGAKTLQGGNIAGLLTGGGVTTVQNGITTVTGTINGNVSVAGSGILRLDSATAVSGTMTATGSTISYADGMVEDSALVLSSAGVRLEVLGGDTASQSGTISSTGAFGFEKIGAGNLFLGSFNSYSGVTTISAGTLTIQGSNSLGVTSAGTVVASGATLALGPTASDLLEVLTLNGFGVGGEGALRNISGTRFVDGAITLGSASLITADAGRMTFGNSVTGNFDLSFGGNGDFTFDGTFASGLAIATGTGALTKNGTGTLTLQASNTYTGTTTVNEGELTVTGSIASGSIIVNAGATLRLEEDSLVNTARIALNDTGRLVLFGSETIVALDSSSFASSVALGSGTLTLNGDGDGTAGEVTTFAGVISGLGGLTKAGDDIQVLTGGNFMGTITVESGELVFSGFGTTSFASALVMNGGTLGINGAHLIVNALSGSGGTIALSASGDTASLAFGADGTDTTYVGNITTTSLTTIGKDGTGAVTLSGVISGGGALISQAGTLLLTETNTYTGTTTVNGGLLDVTGSLASLSNIVNAGGTLRVDGASLSDAATVTLNGSGQLSLTGSEAIGALVPAGGTASVSLNGNTLTLAAQTGNLGLLTLVGSASVDRMDVFLAASLANFSMAGLQFASWTEGTDIVTVTGNALANRLTGSNGKDTLKGGGGNDTLVGGAGNDIYIVEDAGDRVFETTTTVSNIDAGGLDTVLSSVSYSIGTSTGSSFVERLTLTGTGNTNATGNGLNNLLKGNSGNNILDGGTGSDQMFGGAGDDTYKVDAAGDRVFETTTTTSGIDTGGVDTVESAVSFNLGLNAGTQFVEKLTLTGTGNTSGTGNALNNLIQGNTGNNTLNGGTGTDQLLGGAGNDTYFVDDLFDRVFETTTLTSNTDAGGIDTVISSITYNLDLYASVRFAEHLTLTGTGNLNGTGNALGNRITGNDGANQLNGGLGNDTLIGGLGADRFVFNSALGSTNIDRISDFEDGVDKIRLDDAIFVGLTVAGVLDVNAFVANASGQAENASQHIIYETDTGRLFYDVDGLGGTARVQFGVMGIGLAIDNTDFQVV